MDLWAQVAAHLGMITFTAISIGLIVYLAYAMLRPERF
jgi:K+-transporting ATPase KdpF subunit